MPEILLIRADANPQIGTGHVMRCLALAQAWQRSGGSVVLLAAPLPEKLQERLGNEKIELVELRHPPGGVEDGTATIALAKERGAEAVVVDGYQFDADYQRQLKAAYLRLLWVDDYGHARPYVADLVLNQNLGADAAWYRECEAEIQLLLGAPFVLLRQEFLKWQPWKRRVEILGKKVLVTLGGGDAANVTLKVLQSLPPMVSLDVTVLAGASNPNLAELKAHCAAHKYRLLVDATNMPELMAEADLAIAGGGTTVWELAFMGLPAQLITLADNQAASVKNVCAAGAAQSLGRPEELTPEKISHAVIALLTDAMERRKISEQGRKLIDGDGAFRVWLRLRETALQLTRATVEDSKLLWEWANEPGARAVSFSTASIPWADHVRWFEQRLADRHCHLWIARDAAGQPIGQVRFQVTENIGVISVSLEKGQRGRNRGALLIWTACRKLFGGTAVDTVHALVKPDNAASIRAFTKVGFEKTGAKEVTGQPALVFAFTKDRAE